MSDQLPSIRQVLDDLHTEIRFYVQECRNYERRIGAALRSLDLACAQMAPILEVLTDFTSVLKSEDPTLHIKRVWAKVSLAQMFLAGIRSDLLGTSLKSQDDSLPF
jgi:hypothetical protein